MSRTMPWVRLLTGLKYCVFFLVILLALPLSAFRWMPLYLTLGGLFLELRPWDVFWISLAFFAASWSLMTATGLLADGLEQRRPESGSEPYLPAAAARFLSIPITAGQMLAFSAIAVGQTAIVVAVSKSPGLSAVAALGGAVGAYLVLIVLAVPAHLAADFAPIPRWRLVHAIWASFRFLEPLARWLHRVSSKLCAVLRLEAALVPQSDPPRLRSGHFYALTTAAGILILLAAVGWAFFPPAERLSTTPPAGAYLYLLLLLLIWVIAGLDFHLSRHRISPVVVLVAIMASIYGITDTDHYYPAAPLAGGAPGSLTPVEVAAASRAPENLVVVAAAGGGILASGWTTLTLRQMVADRPQLADEIRLLSTVSGGSVGAAHYAHALGKLPDAERTPAGLGRALEQAFKDSVASSLEATAYGLAVVDFERIFLGNSLPVLRRWDRGLLLESSWERIAGDNPTLLGLRPAIRGGRMPALILNSTVMERGHRVMLTPVDFRRVGGVHAPTQTDLLAAGGAEVDLGLWTAARLSATFPYVSPAARSDLPAEDAGDRAYHLIDGGYYENFGLTSTFDFLWPVLEARLEGRGASFSKVLILQLNPFPPGGPPPPKKGLPSAVAGPLLAFVALRNGTQITRNATDLERGLASWQARFDGEEGVDVCLETFEVRPPPDVPEGPLSWHLTPSQIAALEGSWQSVVPQWEEIKSFLERPCVR